MIILFEAIFLIFLISIFFIFPCYVMILNANKYFLLFFFLLLSTFFFFPYFFLSGNQAKLGLMGNYIVEILTAHFLNEKIITAVAKTVSVLSHGNISNRSEIRMTISIFYFTFCFTKHHYFYCILFIIPCVLNHVKFVLSCGKYRVMHSKLFLSTLEYLAYSSTLCLCCALTKRCDIINHEFKRM